MPLDILDEKIVLIPEESENLACNGSGISYDCGKTIAERVRRSLFANIMWSYRGARKVHFCEK